MSVVKAVLCVLLRRTSIPLRELRAVRLWRGASGPKCLKSQRRAGPSGTRNILDDARAEEKKLQGQTAALDAVVAPAPCRESLLAQLRTLGRIALLA
jgi:hypothetical protein